jgi:type I restriction enzyme S subunit
MKPGWEIVKFGDVVRLNTDRIADPNTAGVERYVGLEHITPEDLHIRSWGLVAEGTTFTNAFKPGQVLFGKRRAYQRKVAVAEFAGICSGDIYVLESKDPQALLPELLPFVCQTEGFYQHAVGTSAGSLSPRTNWDQLAGYEFPLPSLDEQRRTAKLLWAVDDLCNSTITLLTKAKQLYDSLQNEIYSGILDVEEGQTNFTTVGELFVSINDKGFLDLPILSVTIDGQVVRREALERFVSDETGDEKYIRALPGDLAYNTMRLWQGAIGIVDEEGLISPAYTIMRLIKTEYPIEFFYHLFRSAKVKNQYRRFVRGIASDRWRIYFKDLSTLLLNMPVPDEAIEAVRKLQMIDEEIDNLKLRYKQTSNLRNFIIEKSLGG